MSELASMSVRELIIELGDVEDAIRLARVDEPSTRSLPPDSGRAVDAEELGGLAAREQRIVHELRRRRTPSWPRSDSYRSGRRSPA